MDIFTGLLLVAAIVGALVALILFPPIKPPRDPIAEDPVRLPVVKPPPTRQALAEEAARCAQAAWDEKAKAAVAAKGKPLGEYRIRKIEGEPAHYPTDYYNSSEQLVPERPPTWCIERHTGTFCRSLTKPHFSPDLRERMYGLGGYTDPAQYSLALEEYIAYLEGHPPEAKHEFGGIAMPSYLSYDDAKRALEQYLDPKTQEVYFDKTGGRSGYLP